MRSYVPSDTDVRAAAAGGGGFLAHRWLMLLAAGGAMAEAGVLLTTAPAARALAPQVTALAPLAVYHDLRWLYGAGGSWAGFVAVLALLAVARITVDAVLVRLAWPGVARPRWPVLLRSAAGAALLAGILLSPLVTLTFGVALLPFSWPLLAALPVLLLVVAVLGHSGVVPWWWRELPPARVAGWALADFLALSAAAALTGWLPAPWAVPVAGLAGLLNARAWYGVTRALAAPRSERRQSRQHVRRIPVAPLAAVMSVALVIGVARLAFSAHSGGARPTTAAAEALRAPASGGRPLAPAGTAGVSRPGSPVLEIQGFGSSCCSGSTALSALSVGGIVQQFSYRGLSARGAPLPYGRSASDLRLALLGDRIAAQVWRLHRQTGKSVDIVAESEGTLGVYAMLARHPHVPLGSIALLSPIVAPGQVSYPATSRGGRGVVPGYELRAVVSFIGSLSPYGSSGAQKLISSVNRSGARFAGAATALARDRPFRWLAVVPLADAVTLPACALPSGAVVVPALHGSLAGDHAVQKIVRAFLGGQTVRAEPGLRDLAQTFAAAATAWRIPQPETPSPPCVAGTAVMTPR